MTMKDPTRPQRVPFPREPRSLMRKAELTLLGIAVLLCLPAISYAGNVPDFNGDGFADLAVGVPLEDIGANADAGAVNVIYGGGTGLNAVAPVLNQFWYQDTIKHAGGSCAAEANDTFGSFLAWGDFNGDGYSDLAIGVPNEDVGLGAVDVIYGSANGLDASAAAVLVAQHLDPLSISPNQQFFGWVVASGDFDGDGYDDLVIGAPTENIGAVVDAGAVFEFHGSLGGLLYLQQWDQNQGTIIGIAEAFDHFGAALTTGDFNGDGFDDMAVGVPGENVEGGVVITDAGAVNAIYGSVGGLSDVPVGGTGMNNQWWWQDSPLILGACGNFDLFGHSVAAGDFNGDSFDDLAVGVPGETVTGLAKAGVVNVLYGAAAGLTQAGDQLWHQNSAGIQGASGAFDNFGHSVAAGDFDGDAVDDVAVGVPYEDIGALNAGAINVIYGTVVVGLTAVGDQLWHQNSPGILGAGGGGDSFGFSVATGDFDGDGNDDLAVGAPGDTVAGVGTAGVVSVLYGTAAGITAAADQLWHQNNTSGVAEAGDGFGSGVYGP